MRDALIFEKGHMGLFYQGERIHKILTTMFLGVLGGFFLHIGACSQIRAKATKCYLFIYLFIFVLQEVENPNEETNHPQKATPLCHCLFRPWVCLV